MRYLFCVIMLLLFYNINACENKMFVLDGVHDNLPAVRYVDVDLYKYDIFGLAKENIKGNTHGDITIKDDGVQETWVRIFNLSDKDIFKGMIVFCEEPISVDSITWAYIPYHKCEIKPLRAKIDTVSVDTVGVYRQIPCFYYGCDCGGISIKWHNQYTIDTTYHLSPKQKQAAGRVK